MTAPLILASASPRRKLLLKELKVPFTVVPSRMLEPPPGLLEAAVYARKLALAKARVVARQFPESWVLGADTVVVHKGEILGKPSDPADGIRMLIRLQGTTHKVITAVALVRASDEKERVAHAVSTVTMKPLSLREIARIAPKHLDQAGCYAAQEKKDPVIRKVEGSYSNVVGLPMEIVGKLLKVVRTSAPERKPVARRSSSRPPRDRN